MRLPCLLHFDFLHLLAHSGHLLGQRRSGFSAVRSIRRPVAAVLTIVVVVAVAAAIAVAVAVILVKAAAAFRVEGAAVAVAVGSSISSQ